MRTLIALSCFTLLFAASAPAATLDENAALFSPATAHDVWHVDWLSNDSDAVAVTTAGRLSIHPSFMQQDATPPVHAVAVEHSDAYLTRAKIHRVASVAT